MTGSCTASSILKELDDLVNDQLKVVTYKWIARQFSIPYDTAKRVLFDYLAKNGQKVKAIYLLSGWNKSEPSQHVVKIIDAAAVEHAKKQLSQVTAMHVYSIQPSMPKDASDIYSADFTQAEALFQQMLKDGGDGNDNPLASNVLSAVICADAKRTAAPRPTSASVVKNPEPAPVKKTSPAKNSTLGKMLSKPATKKQPAKKKPEPKKAVAPKPEPAKPLADSSSSDDSSSSSDSDDDVVVPVARKNKVAAIQDSDSEDEQPAPVVEKKKPSPAKKAPAAKGGKRKNEAAPAKETKPKAAKTTAAGGRKKKVPVKTVTKTYINDKGEEVTETVEVPLDEDEAAAAAAPPAPKPAAKPAESQPSTGAAPAAVEEKKPAATSAAASKAPKKGSKEAAAAATGQKNIMNFFGKK